MNYLFRIMDDVIVLIFIICFETILPVKLGYYLNKIIYNVQYENIALLWIYGLIPSILLFIVFLNLRLLCFHLVKKVEKSNFLNLFMSDLS